MSGARRSKSGSLRAKKKLALREQSPRSSASRSDPAPPARPKRRGRGWSISAGVLALLVGAGALYLFVIAPTEHGPGQGNGVEVTLDGTESATALADKLSAGGLLASPRVFALWLALTGGTSGLVPGTHLLTDDASPREIMARLERRAGGGHLRVTFPEGWTRFDMAKRLQDKHVCTLRGFLDATAEAALLKELAIDAPNAEGFLFPATYDLPLDADPKEVVRRMKGEFDKRWITLEEKHQSGMLDLSLSLKFGKKEVVTLASMVEKEAAVDDERAVIASVFLNRLRNADFTPKLLQCDPTAGYGCLVQPDLASCQAYAGKITPAINRDPQNAYSTYEHEGLPPGPISNPGAKSIEAVMAPANTRYLYFVAKGEGRHTFSETYAAHAAAVKH